MWSRWSRVRVPSATLARRCAPSTLWLGPVAQRTEREPSKLRAVVRFHPGPLDALNRSRTTSAPGAVLSIDASSLLLVPCRSLVACGSQHVAPGPRRRRFTACYGRARARLGLPARRRREADRALRARPRRPEGDDAVPPPAWLEHLAREGVRGDLPRLRDATRAAAAVKHIVQGVANALPHVANGRPGGGDRLLARRTARGRLRERLFESPVSSPGRDPQRLPGRADGPAARPRAAERAHEGADPRRRPRLHRQHRRSEPADPAARGRAASRTRTCTSRRCARTASSSPTICRCSATRPARAARSGRAPTGSSHRLCRLALVERSRHVADGLRRFRPLRLDLVAQLFELRLGGRTALRLALGSLACARRSSSSGSLIVPGLVNSLGSIVVFAHGRPVPTALRCQPHARAWRNWQTRRV